MVRALLFPLVIAAGFTAVPASAEVFKWVDEDGTTHYSDRGPAKGRAQVVPQRISVYEAKEALRSAAPARDRLLESRIERLENQLESERRARADYVYAADYAWQAAYQQCVNDRRVDCDGRTAYYPSYAAYAPYVAVNARRSFGPVVTARVRSAPPREPVTHFNPALFGSRAGPMRSARR